jgi:hypothetical protein
MTRLQSIERKIDRLRAQLEKLEDERTTLIPHHEPDVFSKLLAQGFIAPSGTSVPLDFVLEHGLMVGEIDIEIKRGGKS